MLVAAVILAVSSVPELVYLAQAHDQRETLVAATKAKEFGIETYRIRQNGNGLRPDPKDPSQPTTTQVFADLLNATGQQMGAMHVTIHWTKERDADLKINKYFERAKKYELKWLQETFTTQFENESITVSYNGTQVYSGPITGATKEQFDAVVLAHPDLLKVAGAVEADLNKHYQATARDVARCCGMEAGDIVCSGGQYWREGYALQRSEACEKAVTAVQYACWNAYCIGCCAVSDCNALCFPDSDFFCIGKVKGTACRCSKFLV